jgi:transcriptional regulator with XRE-family HTH domain
MSDDVPMPLAQPVLPFRRMPAGRRRGRPLSDVAAALERRSPEDMRAAGLSSAAMRAGELIRGMRVTAGLSQAQLAARIGVGQPRIAELEVGAGRHGPSWDVMERIAAACGRELGVTGMPATAAEPVAARAAREPAAAAPVPATEALLPSLAQTLVVVVAGVAAGALAGVVAGAVSRFAALRGLQAGAGEEALRLGLDRARGLPPSAVTELGEVAGQDFVAAEVSIEGLAQAPGVVVIQPRDAFRAAGASGAAPMAG